jgi:hypothetical protein
LRLKASEEITGSSTVGMGSTSCRLRCFPLTELACVYKDEFRFLFFSFLLLDSSREEPKGFLVTVTA